MTALLPDASGRLAPTTTAVPPLRPGEVLLEVRAAGVNRADLSQLAGHYPPPPGESSVLGLEAAGQVVELGPGVEAGLGLAACALLAGGGYAERVAVPASMLIELPHGWSFAEAAAFPETALTAFLNLFLEARLQPGERVLIHGGASGVGTAAIKQAKLAGATVVTTAGGPEKVDVCRRLGADLALDRHGEPFRDVVKRELGAVDVVLDMVGESYFAANLDLLATGGRLVVIATLGGRRAELDLRQLMGKRARLIGSTLRSRPLEEKVRIKEAFLERFGEAVASGELKPVIDAVVPWERVNEAHERMRENRTIGKLVLEVGGADAGPSGGG
ncbi:MAG: NAD(P)H-quinone oxidoreductase [Deinococcales bacterium]|nr:NAD(P)H-quinone oxidoreductase [Deinococcales bacterium]